MMLWFLNLRASPIQFLGLRYEEDDGMPALRLLYPDGAQVMEPFSSLDALIESATRLQDELLRRGWWLSMDSRGVGTPES
jgi:hypothetical protein